MLIGVDRWKAMKIVPKGFVLQNNEMSIGVGFRLYRNNYPIAIYS
jgi:hypothetical protein